ncbi:MAG: hypothetical protein IPI04_09000 [Ignavibacteria bacterium]|nr:hypothetical protein [Ignavibacteria bacterium]
MYKYKASKDMENLEKLILQETGLALVVLMIGHYILMHFQPESGYYTCFRVLARMQFRWYRLTDLTFITLGMYHGLNGIWNIFRDWQIKTLGENFHTVSAYNSWTCIYSMGLQRTFLLPYINSISGN